MSDERVAACTAGVFTAHLLARRLAGLRALCRPASSVQRARAP